jgi:hypothetical protein
MEDGLLNLLWMEIQRISGIQVEKMLPQDIFGGVWISKRSATSLVGRFGTDQAISTAWTNSRFGLETTVCFQAPTN